MVLVATEILGGSSAACARVASEAGASGIHVSGEWLVGGVAPLVAEAAGAGLAPGSMFVPLAERAPAPGKRLPHLGALAPDERAAALALASAGLAAGAAVGITRAVVGFGPVTLRASRADVERYFRRRAGQLGSGEPGAELLEIALADRKSQSAALFDACRFSLEGLCREAERRGVRLLVPPCGTPWGVPSPREAEALLEAFTGAPVALAWDPGQLSVLRGLGLPLSAERARALAARAGGAIENDAVGMQAGYLPGLGERDEDLPPRADLKAAGGAADAGAPVIVTGNRDATPAEIAAAVARVGALYG